MGDIIELAKRTAQDNIFAIILVSSAAIVATIIMIIDRVNKRNKYVTWKKQTINLGIYTREWERSDDVLLQQLFDENERLEKENKALKKEYNLLSLAIASVLLFIALISWFANKINSISSGVNDFLGSKKKDSSDSQ